MPRRSASRTSRSSSMSQSRSRRRSRSRRSGSRHSRSPSPPPRRTVRTRSRSRSGDLERSVSRELYAEEKPKLKEIHKLVQSQQDLVYNLLKEHKEEVKEKLTAKSRRFASKQLEKQFQVNLKFKELVGKIQQAHSDRHQLRTSWLVLVQGGSASGTAGSRLQQSSTLIWPGMVNLHIYVI
jgi:hypothetical protein